VSYRVLLRRAAQKQLDRIPEDDYTAVARVITALEEESRPRGVKKLSESGLWRVRVGRYRMVYSIDDEERLIILVRVARRAEDTYRRL
jgi:mRNA interferase RelE/StbE